MLDISVENQPRLDMLAAKLASAQPFQRRLSYRESEQACECLAEKILQVYSRQELARFYFAAIPRGGLIVLGMLSYVLGLRLEQMSADWRSPGGLVIVDDCAYTGARFSRMLAETSAAEVVFAHLYSHPRLRASILATESQVEACISAHDLVDRTPKQFADRDRFAAWQQQRLQRLGGGRYWTGFSEGISFPWTEPDQPFWNPVTEHLDDGWRFFPPQQCLKNKYRWALPPRLVQTPSLQVPMTTVAGEFDEVLWLCKTQGGEIFALEGVAADMWKGLAVYGDIDVAADYLLGEYATDAETMLADLRAFADTLLSKGLLERI